MDSKMQYLISKDNGKLQLPYAEYLSLMDKLDEARRVMQVRAEVLAGLLSYQEGPGAVMPEMVDEEEDIQVESYPEEESEKVSIEFSSDEAQDDDVTEVEKAATAPRQNGHVEIPPIKKEIAAHFNSHDNSGRLFNVFKQYYTCLNENCGGTVRVTMKDGVCSLWNYDQWEEFAFVDILDGALRFALDPRYTDDLSVLDFCEGSRLLTSRRNLVSIKLGDLNKTMLNVLARAFNEVGMTAS